MYGWCPTARKHDETRHNDAKCRASTTKDLPTRRSSDTCWMASLPCTLATRFTPAKGDAFYNNCDRIHYIENTGKKAVEIIWISTPPNL